MADNIISNIGDVLIVRIEPKITGRIRFTEYTETIENETSTRSLKREFRISQDGIFWTDWAILNIDNLASEEYFTDSYIKIEIRYTRTGTDETEDIVFKSIDFNGTREGIQFDAPTLQSSIFSNLIGTNVLAKLERNIFKKLYYRGILPNYIERAENSSYKEDKDFVDLFYSVARFFALFISFFRRWENFKNDEDLLREQVHGYGIYFNENDTALSELQYLAQNLFSQAQQRGTEMIFKHKGDEIVSGLTTDSSHPYYSLIHLKKYLYEVKFDILPQDNNQDTAVGFGCSSYVQNGKLYRNLDFHYDNSASFIVKCNDFTGMSFVTGLNEGDLKDDLISQLPYKVVDGVNKNGIMVSTHVLFNDWNWSGVGSSNINLTSLPYLVLTRVKSMATISSDLSGVLNNLYAPSSMTSTGYLLQVLVTDGQTTYAIIPPTSPNQSFVLQNITSNPKLTNFRWVSTKVAVKSDLQLRPTGIERFNMMPCPLEDLRFTKCYETSDRLSEFIGINDTTKDSSDSQLLSIYKNANLLYEQRKRNGETWQTVHSVIYGTKGLESLYIQEDWTEDCALINIAPIDGEFVRLTRNRICDELLYENIPLHKTGWCLGNSSPIYRGTAMAYNLNKTSENTKDFQSLSNFVLSTSGTGSYALESTDNKRVIRLSATSSGTGHSALGRISSSTDVSGNIYTADSQLDYEITFAFKINAATNLSQLALHFGVEGFDINKEKLNDAFSTVDGFQVSEDFFDQPMNIWKKDQWYYARGIIHAYSSENVIDSKTNLGIGKDLVFNNSFVKYIIPKIEVYTKSAQNASVDIYDYKIRPLIRGKNILPLKDGSMNSHGLGFIQGSKILYTYVRNNNNGQSEDEIIDIIERYLYPFNTVNMFTITGNE